MQAAIMYCGVVGISAVDTHFVLDVEQKIVEQIFTNLEVSRSRYVTHKEKQIRLGGWKDVEADEVDLGKGVVDNPLSPRTTSNGNSGAASLSVVALVP